MVSATTIGFILIMNTTMMLTNLTFLLIQGGQITKEIKR
jgi:hypothetical protein